MAYEGDIVYGDDGFVPRKSVVPDEINQKTSSEGEGRKPNRTMVLLPILFVLLYGLITVYINVYKRLKVADHLGENCDAKCISNLHREDKLRMWYILVTAGLNALISGSLLVKMNKSPDDAFIKMALIPICLWSIISILLYRTYSHAKILGEDIKEVKRKDNFANVLLWLNPVVYLLLLVISARSMGGFNFFGKSRLSKRDREFSDDGKP